MNSFIQITAGLAIGAVTTLAAFWLFIIYPYAEVSLKRFWISLGCGLALGAVAILAIGFVWASVWLKD